MTTQAKFHWQFKDKSGATTTVDSISKVQAKLSDAKPSGHGRIGRAMHLLKKDSHISLGKAVGQFGTSDFTIAFGMKNISNHGDKELDIIGSQTMKGHGNFFSVRLSDKRRIFFHVDENSKAKHYVRVQTDPLSMVDDRTWFHVAVVRNGPTLQIYIDGVLSATAKSKTGVANIKNNTDVKLGHSRRHTPNAQYEDLRIYDRALDAAEIQALIPPINRPLSHGEIELVATDGAAMILRGDVGHLSRFSQEFQRLRVGPDTAVALFNKASFEGTSQLLYADLPDIKLSRLKGFPASVRIRSAIGNPFTGKWLIKAPNGQFLSLLNFPVPFKGNKKGLNAMLITSPKRSFNELFQLQQQSKQSRTQLVHDANKENALFRLSPKTETIPLFIEELQPLSGEFAIVNQAQNQWLEMGEKNTFQWTDQKEKRAVFARVAKMADKENQVGELAPGEVALYEHVAYYGRTWILSDTEKDLSGEYPNLSAFESLQDKTSSIRLGPKTGVTVFRDNQFRGSADEASLIEDIVDNVPSLFDSQIGNDTISSIKILRFIDPTEIFTSYTSKLSQDYRMVGNKLEEFSAYRTTLRLEPDTGEIEVSATDLTQIEVDGENYVIDEQRTVTLKPNLMNHIMITSEADGIDTPGLKFRTQSMAPNEQVVIFPNQDVHRQIAELEDDALWNATDTQGNLIVDHKAHSQEEVASVQNTIKRMMGTVAYADKESTVSTRSVTKRDRNSVGAATQSVSGATIEDNPWELNLGKVTPSNQVIARKSGVTFAKSKSLTSSVATTGIEGKAISQSDFARLLSQSTSSEKAAPPQPSKGFGTINGVAERGLIGSIGRGIKKTVKKAKSVVVGAVKGVVHVLVKTVEGVIDFVVDTVKKVAEFVEAVVETVVKAVKKFIEFLQFLFNWGDILDTQRYLKGAINTSLDSAKQLAVDAKPHVQSFVDDLQGGVEDGMNHLVKTLGGKPSEVEESGFEIPEALEWFLSKFLGGSKSSDSETTPDSGSDDSPLASFVRQMLEAFEDAVGAGLQLSEGVFDSIQTLIANPSQPEAALIVMIEALRDSIIQSLDAVENVALNVLDVAGLTIDLFKGFLNAEIRIPFISDLLDFIGVGKLTVLNLATIVLAIPVTITAKLVTGEHLFANSVPMPLDLANQQGTPRAVASVTTNRSAIAVSTDSSNDAASADETDEPDSLRDLRKDLAFTIIGTWADTINHQISGILDLFDVPEFETDGGDSKLLRRFNKEIGSIQTAFIKPLQGLEITSVILSYVSWILSYPAESLSEDFRDRDKENHREIMLWSYRVLPLTFDVVSLISNDCQRMRRVEPEPNILWVLLSGLDMSLSAFHLAAIEEENDRIKRANISNEVFSWLPNFASFVRSIKADITTRAILHVFHLGCNASAMAASLTTGGILIKEANKALKEAR